MLPLYLSLPFWGRGVGREVGEGRGEAGEGYRDQTLQRSLECPLGVPVPALTGRPPSRFVLRPQAVGRQCSSGCRQDTAIAGLGTALGPPTGTSAPR